MLNSLANTNLENAIIDSFIAQLPQQNDTLDLLFKTASEQSSPIQLQTSFPVDAVLHKKLDNALGQISDKPIATHHQVNKKLVCGVALIAAGHKLEWSVNHYLEGLEHSILRITQHVTAGVT